MVTLLAIADINGDGKISLEELMEPLDVSSSKATVSTVSSSFMILNTADQTKATFKKFDTNNDEHLERNELKNVLCFAGAHPSKQEADVIFRKEDIDEDGKIDQQVFIKLMFHKPAEAINKLQKSFSNFEQVKAVFRQYDADEDKS